MSDTNAPQAPSGAPSGSEPNSTPAAGGTPAPAPAKPVAAPAAPAAAKPAADPAKLAAAAAAKSAAAKKPSEPLPPPPELQTRRTFLEWGLAAWGIFALFMGGISHLCLRFMFPRVLYEKDPKFRAGKKSDFPELNKVYEQYKESQGTWIIRIVEDGEDHLAALSTTCTHLGCTPNWLDAEQKFKCPCHGSGFYRTGINFEGPAPRPLERYRIFIDASGDVIIDRAVKFRKDLQQWGGSESFIKMT